MITRISRLLWPKRITIVVASLLAAYGIWFAVFRTADSITNFDYARDAQEIHALFKRDWYWLVAATPEEYDVDFVLRYQARRHTVDAIGSLTIKVLREDNDFKGFVVYYKKDSKNGFLLFLSVKDTARRKGYGEELARYAIQDLLSQGVSTIELVTRPSNERALNLYRNKLGFHETHRDNDFVYLAFQRKP